MVTEHVAGELYVVITPDGDVYSEELSMLNSDIRSMRVRGANNRLPADVPAAEVYALPHWPPPELTRLRDEARAVAERERGGAVVAAPAAGAALAPAAALIPSGDASEDMKFAAGVVEGAKAIHTLPSGRQIFVECVDGADLEKFKQKPSLCDDRILPQLLNAMQMPERSLKDVASACVERKMPWSITGPRTARWCVSYLAVENLGFEGHHERLRQVSKSDASSWGIQEHFQVSMALRQALLVDQVDAFNMLSVEIQFRRLQTIEFSYSERAKEAESKAVGGRLSLEEQTTFGGVTRQYSTLMICPELLDFVKQEQETEKEASLAKNLRKAREERESARRGKKGKASEDP
eukprot:Skav222633  [mRNA]  locus=scaffold10:186469:187585:+ [translate_table: standard]